MLDVLVALSLPLYLLVEHIVDFRRKRRRAALAAVRKRTRHAALEPLLRGLDSRVRQADHPGTS
jgi:hypothetical protein